MLMSHVMTLTEKFTASLLYKLSYDWLDLEQYRWRRRNAWPLYDCAGTTRQTLRGLRWVTVTPPAHWHTTAPRHASSTVSSGTVWTPPPAPSPPGAAPRSATQPAHSSSPPSPPPPSSRDRRSSLRPLTIVNYTEGSELYEAATSLSYFSPYIKGCVRTWQHFKFPDIHISSIVLSK